MSSDYSYIRVYVCFAFLGPEAWVCPRYQSDSAASSPFRECGNDVLITQQQQQQQQVEPDSLTKMIEGHQTHRPFLFPESGIASGCFSLDYCKYCKYAINSLLSSAALGSVRYFRFSARYRRMKPFMRVEPTVSQSSPGNLCSVLSSTATQWIYHPSKRAQGSKQHRG